MVQRTLCKSPEERYSTGEAFARELEVIKDSIPRFIKLDGSNCIVGPLRISLKEGDLSAEAADVLVSASNTSLAMNIGVSAALVRRAGRKVEREAIAQGPCAMGDVVWTGAGDVHARFIAHAVAALDGAVCLQRATLRVLLGAEKRSCESIAFPALGTGAGNVPMDLAAKLMLEAMNTFSFLSPKHVRTIRIILRDAVALKRWQAVLASMT
jgi:O-acetyl-ADP-ribose deacetylase (regulator of RNase III)